MPKRQIIFDMDGVITSEDGYWRAASCALLDLAAHLGHADSANPDPWQLTPDLGVIARAKALLINTNWDLCHLAAIALGWRLCRYDPENESRLLLAHWDSDEPGTPLHWPPHWQPDLNVLVGEIIEHAGEDTGFSLMEALAQKTGTAAPRFARQGPIWQWLFHRFQRWFNGDVDRKGIIADEQLLRAPKEIAYALSKLHYAGWRLGIATGRTREELIPTLSRFGLLDYFEPGSIVTHDEVALAEREAPGTHLSKPHPFPFLRALFPNTPTSELLARTPAPLEGEVVVVGDTVADMAAAVAIGATPIAVLTGPGGIKAREALAQAGARIFISDVTVVHLSV